jgi:predicted esterase
LPILCFLHGLGEGHPLDIYSAIERHGPLRPESAPSATRDFIVVAPQLPERGDLWRLYSEAVVEIVGQVQWGHGGDPKRTYLTGFSFGGNGVFDLALDNPRLWAALWAVDPTRVPPADPDLPVWLSAGEASRSVGSEFIERLQLQPPGPEVEAEDRIVVDEGLGHVGTATSAYRDERIYRWLLAKRAEDVPA